MNVTQYVLIGLIVVLLIVYPILISSKNKKQAQQLQEQINSLKKGDKVLTTSGVYGVVVELNFTESSKIVVLETGSNQNKGYMSVDAYAIYTIIREESEVPTEVALNPVQENSVQEKPAIVEEEKSALETLEEATQPKPKKSTSQTKKTSSQTKKTTSKSKKQS